MNITIKDLVYKKEALIDTLNDIIPRYFLNKMYELNDMSKREIQKTLYEIPNWSERKREKEFARFLKYIYKKKHFSESDLNSMISDIVFLNVKMLSRSPIEINAPDAQTFWYKLMNLIGRYFYNKIKYKKEIIDKESDTKYIQNLIDIFFQKYIPLNDLIDIREVEKVSYNFDFDEPDVYLTEPDVNLTEPEPIDLKFVSPDHFYFKQHVAEERIPDDILSRKEIHIKPKLNLL